MSKKKKAFTKKNNYKQGKEIIPLYLFPHSLKQERSTLRGPTKQLF